MASSPLRRFHLSFTGGLLLAALAIAPLPLGAAPLEKQECERLKAEKQSLAVLGVEKEIAKGPEWVKANLKEPQLDLVKRYIAVDEQLKFRCRPALATPSPKRAQTAAARKAQAVKAAAIAQKKAAAKDEKQAVKATPVNAKPAGAAGD